MNNFKPPKHLGKELSEYSAENSPPRDGSEISQDFQVPEHVTRELGRTAGETSSANDLLESGLKIPAPDLEEAQLQGEIAIYSALKSWQKYSYHPDFKTGKFRGKSGIPEDISEFKDQHKFYEQALANIYSGYLSIKNAEWPICDAAQPATTKLVLIPYRYFYDNLRRKIGDTTSLTYSLIELSDGATWAQRYSLPPIVHKTARYKNPKDNSNLLELRDYAKAKVEQERDWGLALTMLAPAHPQGINSLNPTGFARHPQVIEHHTDKFGLLEWFALNLQEGSQLDPDYYDFLPAHTTEQTAYLVSGHNGAVASANPALSDSTLRRIKSLKKNNPRFRLAINGN